MNGGDILVTNNGTILDNGGSAFEMTVQIASGGAFINTNGFNTSSLRQLSDVAGQHGMFTKLGLGTLTLSNTGSWSGGTAINGGILSLNNANALPTTGHIGFGGGTLQYSSVNQVDFSSQIASSGSAVSIDTNGQNVTFASSLPASNTGGLAKLGGGQLTLSASNGYSGGTTVAGGILQMANANALGLSPSSLEVDAGTLDLFGNNLTVTTLNGNNALGSITTSQGGNLTLTVNGTGNGVYSGAIQDGAGQLSLTKTGSGMLTLGGANSYSGNTLINGGVLGVANGNAIEIASNIIFGGGTLQLSGQISITPPRS